MVAGAVAGPTGGRTAAGGRRGPGWGRRGTRLRFCGHMGTQFSMMVFALLWGVPYLESAQHLSASAAGALMTLFVLGMICIGPVVGIFTSRYPARRSRLLLTLIAA